MLIPDTTAAAAHHAAAMWNLDRPLQLVRVGTGVVYRSGRLAVRVCDPALGTDWPARERTLARAAADAGAQVTRPAPLPTVHHPHGMVSAWHWEPHGAGGAPTADELAALVAGLHQLDPAALAPVDPFRKIRLWWTVAVEQQLADPALLAAAGDLVAPLERDFTQLVADGPVRVVHGDLNAGNVVRRPDGTLVLLDLEDGGAGPVELDLMASMTATRLYRDPPGALDALADALGIATDTARFATVCRVRFLLSALWTVTGQLRDPVRFTDEEATVRLATAVDGRLRRWTRI